MLFTKLLVRGFLPDSPIVFSNCTTWLSCKSKWTLLVCFNLPVCDNIWGKFLAISALAHIADSLVVYVPNCSVINLSPVAVTYPVNIVGRLKAKLLLRI